MKRVVPYLDEAGRCYAGAPPSCARACPLGVDLPAFLNKCKSGSFSHAWKLYAKDAVLPGVTCYICPQRCAAGCVRSGLDAPPRVLELERFCMLQQRGRPEAVFYSPEKQQRILVVGAGPAGLVCGVKLAQRGYPVELWEASDRLGGSLWDYGEDILPREAIESELARVQRIKHLRCITGKAAAEETFPGFDAVILATGCREEPYSAKKAQGEGGVFYAGACWDPALDTMELIRESALLTYDVESFCKVGRIAREEPKPLCLYDPDPSELTRLPLTQPGPPEGWDAETAKAEASRCAECKCTKCFDACQMMQWHKKDARTLTRDINTTVNKFILNRKDALRQISDCYQCGECKELCPLDIDFGTLCLETRRYLHEGGKYPDSIFDYCLDDMEHANGERASVLLPAAGARAEVLFFPGCQLSASMPEYIPKVYEWLQAQYAGAAALLLQCCGIPALWAGQEDEFRRVLDGIERTWQELGKPVLLTACPSCRRILAGNLPQITVRMLWSELAERFEPAASRDMSLYVFDPCGSRGFPELPRAIRELAKRTGCTVANPCESAAHSKCCGFGGLLPASNRELAEHIAAEDAGLSALPFLTYCSNCQDSFARQGKESYHILSLLFDQDPCGEAGCRDRSQRRDNREELKRSLQPGEAAVERPWAAVRLVLSDELRAQMDRELILTENLQRAIYSELSGGGFAVDPESGAHSVGVRQRNTTFWVRFLPEGDGYRVLAVYCHRMRIGAKEEA